MRHAPLSMLMALLVQISGCKGISHGHDPHEMPAMMQIDGGHFSLILNGREFSSEKEMVGAIRRAHGARILIRCSAKTTTSDLFSPLDFLGSHSTLDYEIATTNNIGIPCFLPASTISLNAKLDAPHETYMLDDILKWDGSREIPPYSRIEFPDRDVLVKELVECLAAVSKCKCLILEHRRSRMFIFIGSQKDWED